MKHTILSSHFCLFQNSLIDLLTSKSSCFITKNIWNAVLRKKRKKGFWTSNLFFSCLIMSFYQLGYLIWSDGVCCILSMSYQVLTFIIDFSSFHNELKQLCSLKLVSILRATLWKAVVKCKIFILFNFLSCLSQNVYFWGCKILSYQVSSLQST